MFKKVGIFLMVAMMLSSVALAFDNCPADDWENKQESKQEERKVLQFDKEVVKKIMMEENSYSSREADDEIFILGELNAKLQPVLDAYIADRTMSDAFEVEGLTTKMVIDKYGENFWQGLLSMNGFIKDPERAKRTRNDLTPVSVHSLGEK